MIGEVDRDRLITPRGANDGDRVLLTKGVPIEATALLARDFSGRLQAELTRDEIEEARNYLFEPGIGITRDARVAIEAGRVTAMHDPTEGGIITALWELAEASQKTLRVAPELIPIPPLARRVCEVFAIDPLSSIASGSLLITASAQDANSICEALQQAAITCVDIGVVVVGSALVQRSTPSGFETWPRPAVDAFTKALAV